MPVTELSGRLQAVDVGRRDFEMLKSKMAKKEAASYTLFSNRALAALIFPLVVEPNRSAKSGCLPTSVSAMIPMEISPVIISS